MAHATEQHPSLNSPMKFDSDHLKPQCEKCFGLCCTALYFSAQDGFPADKNAGTPCQHLSADFHCTVHERLADFGLKGCIAYECFGAGQQVSQVTFAGRDWRLEPSSAGPMFEGFLMMQQLHEMCWYLQEALSFQPGLPIHEEIKEALYATERVTRYAPRPLIEFDLPAHRAKISLLLGAASSLMRRKISRDCRIACDAPKRQKAGADYLGKDLRKKELRCADLRSACLIAANLEGSDLSGSDLIGADLRDTNLKGADLSRSIFLTQSQINADKGDSATKLPPLLTPPKHWG